MPRQPHPHQSWERNIYFAVPGVQVHVGCHLCVALLQPLNLLHKALVGVQGKAVPGDLRSF